MSHGIHQYGGGLMPPSFHVGCLPVRTSDGAAPEDIAQPLVLNWKFDTYCVIEYGFDPYGEITPKEMQTYSTGTALLLHQLTYQLGWDINYALVVILTTFVCKCVHKKLHRLLWLQVVLWHLGRLYHRRLQCQQQLSSPLCLLCTRQYLSRG